MKMAIHIRQPECPWRDPMAPRQTSRLTTLHVGLSADTVATVHKSRFPSRNKRVMIAICLIPISFS